MSLRPGELSTSQPPQTSREGLPLFHYPGGKRRMAPVIWQALGNPRTYVEPFGGSLAVLLQRPREHLTPDQGRRFEVVNDLSGRLVNLYRAIKSDPEAVWESARGPRATLDMTARHRALRQASEVICEKLRDDPQWFDAQLAGWQLYNLRYATHPRAAVAETRNTLGRPTVNPTPLTLAEIQSVADRMDLSRMMILCGDWARTLTAKFTEAAPLGVFLDPPYVSALRDDALYPTEGRQAGRECREWAISVANDSRFRIVLCGYDDEGCPDGWTELPWTSQGGKPSNRSHERLWFSPHCLPIDQ